MHVTHRRDGRRGKGFPVIPDIVPSLYAAGPESAIEAAMACAEAEDAQFHLDVMDGRFVPATGVSLPTIGSVAAAVPGAPLHVHLMVEDSDSQVGAVAEAGATTITVHAEAVADVGATLTHIRRLGRGSGVALSPASDPASLEGLQSVMDSILVMLVHPGRPDQSMIPAMLDKIRHTRLLFPDTIIVVDGRLDEASIPLALDRGADLFVCGRSVFGGPPAERLSRLRGLLRHHNGG
ncbi:MAG: ribulose-phosphate 3-epimerase [Rhodospirillales bacterium]|nr:ribulose-phosphate 3-epimerase [Rhodospirillales bacterium]